MENNIYKGFPKVRAIFFSSEIFKIYHKVAMDQPTSLFSTNLCGYIVIRNLMWKKFIRRGSVKLSVFWLEHCTLWHVVPSSFHGIIHICGFWAYIYDLESKIGSIPHYFAFMTRNFKSPVQFSIGDTACRS